MSDIIIVTGGHKEIEGYRKILTQVDNPTIIGVDGGALWLIDHGERLDLAVGDFDTIGKDGLEKLLERGVEILGAVAEKDETDTELAFHLAAQRNASKIIIFGGLGSRFDHSFTNVQLLWKALVLGIPCELIDPWNRVRLIKDSLTVHKEYTYVSLIPFTPKVCGISLIGFKYPLTDATLEWGKGRGISNEIVGEHGMIILKEGLLLVIESADQK
jgi:thiamine pyrophosphokinase